MQARFRFDRYTIPTYLTTVFFVLFVFVEIGALNESLPATTEKEKKANPNATWIRQQMARKRFARNKTLQLKRAPFTLFVYAMQRTSRWLFHSYQIVIAAASVETLPPQMKY